MIAMSGQHRSQAWLGLRLFLMMLFGAMFGGSWLVSQRYSYDPGGGGYQILECIGGIIGAAIGLVIHLYLTRTKRT